MKKILIKMIKFYKKNISPLKNTQHVSIRLHVPSMQ